MIDPPDALARLVGDAPAFAASTFGRAPQHVPAADAEGFADLLCLEDVDHLVASSGLRAPGFRVVREGRTLPTPAVTRRVRIGSRPVDDLVDVAAVHAAFAEGATIVLQGLHRSFAPVASFCRQLEGALTHPVQANAYLTPPVAQGLHLHEDPHDVFAVQTHGRKRWVVHPDDRGEPWDLTLAPGDVLYLPAGTRHAAQTLETASLHLTLGVRTVTWRAAVRRLVDQALADTELDAPLPAAWADDPGKLRAELERRLAAVQATLAEGPDAVAALEAEARAFRRRRSPDRAGGLRDLLALDELDDDTPLRVRPDQLVGITRDGDRATLELTDRSLDLPAGVAPVLDRLVARGTFRPGDLDDLIDEDSRRVLCRRLVREGWLTIDRPGTPRA